MTIAIEPNEKWSLDDLGQFCRTRTDRMAVDAWETGKAMALAKKKTTHGEFTSWKRKWRYSDATVSRYIRLYKAYKTADSLCGKEIMEALREAEVVSHRQVPPAKQKQIADPVKRYHQENQGCPAQKSPSTSISYPWVVDEFSGASELEEAEAFDPGIEAISVKIEQLLVEFLTLTKQIDWITSQENKLLVRVWPREESAGIRAGAEEIQQALQKLVKLIPN